MVMMVMMMMMKMIMMIMMTTMVKLPLTYYGVLLRPGARYLASSGRELD
tara:strand:+ start:207 stop:353 length:147 start_codon:yes stop_codon:yes gene_type:complete